MTNEYVFSTGHNVPVEVEADSAGTVAREGEAVHLKSEDSDAVQVELVEAVSDRAVAILTEDPKDFQDDPNAAQSDYSSGDSAGMASAAILYPIIWMDTDSGYTPSVGDYVEVGDGGDIEAYTGPTASSVSTLTNTLGVDGSGNLEHDGGSDIDIDFTSDAFPYGTVFTSVAREWGVGDKTGVIKGVF